MHHLLGLFSFFWRNLSAFASMLKSMIAPRQLKRSQRKRKLHIECGWLRVNYESRHDDEGWPPRK
jgi:hypothetical protein